MIVPFFTGWLLDLAIGDPERLPHPVVWFGKAISFGERWLNKGSYRRIKGGLLAIGLILLVLGGIWGLRTLLALLPSVFLWVFDAIAVFYCLNPNNIA